MLRRGLMQAPACQKILIDLFGVGKVVVSYRGGSPGLQPCSEHILRSANAKLGAISIKAPDQNDTPHTWRRAMDAGRLLPLTASTTTCMHAADGSHGCHSDISRVQLIKLSHSMPRKQNSYRVQAHFCMSDALHGQASHIGGCNLVGGRGGKEDGQRGARHSGHGRQRQKIPQGVQQCGRLQSASVPEGQT